MPKSKIEYEKVMIRLHKNAKLDYISLTDMIRAFKENKTIEGWLRKKETIAFLTAWEKFNNPEFTQSQSTNLKIRSGKSNTSEAVIHWIERSNACSLYIKRESPSVIYAQKDIAFKFASWLNQEFELFIIREFHTLKDIEQLQHTTEHLSHHQLLSITQLKEVLKFVAHQDLLEVALEKINSANISRNPFSDFHFWRNKILDLVPIVINKRIRQYCIENGITRSKISSNPIKKGAVLPFNSYEAMRNIIWEFLQMNEVPTTTNLIKLLKGISAAKKKRVPCKSANLLMKKVSLGEYTDFNNQISETVNKKTARQLIALRKEIVRKQKSLTVFDKYMKGILIVSPPK